MYIFNFIGLGCIFFIAFLLMAVITQSSISGFGYKMPSAMKNIDTWNEANKFIGKVGIVVSIISISAGLLAYYNVIGNSKITNILSLALIAFAFVITEIHMSKTFTHDGKRK